MGKGVAILGGVVLVAAAVFMGWRLQHR